MSREKKKLEELNQVSVFSVLLAVAIESGLSLTSAIDTVSSRMSGEVARGFQRLILALNYGGILHDELHELRRGLPPAATELIIKLQVAQQFGSPLAMQLEQLAATLTNQMANLRVTMATKQENLMLLPLVFLILPVTVLFSVYPSMQFLRIPI